MILTTGTGKMSTTKLIPAGWELLMRLTEIAIFTEQVKQMSDFYRRLLEAEPVTQSDTISIFFIDNIKIFIHKTYSPHDRDLPPENHHAYLVENVDAACQRLVEQGLTLEIPPRDFTGDARPI